MAVGLNEPTQVYNIPGIRLSTAAAGIRYQNRDDLTLIELAAGSTVAAVFTQNKFCAAPVLLAQEHLQATLPRYLVINAGNANAGTGTAGMQATSKSCEAIAKLADVLPKEILPFSTGVIGELLDAEKIEKQAEGLFKGLSETQWLSAAKAIMTTDTVPKAYSKTVSLNNKTISITGIAKGSGMIQPNMATMLAYIGTDLGVEKNTLQRLLKDCTETSFNSITVDSDTSTNDACVLIATGKSSVKFEILSENDQKEFVKALRSLMQMLAQAIVRDGEGATKFVSVNISQAISYEQAKKIAYSVANSPLVKTAVAASDANWGRVMAAVGKCDDEDLNLSKTNLIINGVSIIKQAELADTYNEALGSKAMQEDEINIEIQLGLGDAQSTVWTTDLTHEYVRINAEYRT